MLDTPTLEGTDMARITMHDMHSEMALALWNVAYQAYRYATTYEGAGSAYSDNTVAVRVGTDSELSVGGHLTAALRQALTHAYDEDEDAADRMVEVLWNHVEAGYGALAAFQGALSQASNEVTE